MPQITAGRIVLYALSASDVEKIPLDFEIPVHTGRIVPLIVVRVSANGDKPSVNGQAILDGEYSTLWVRDAAEGTTPGTWHWPERV